ncbi:hypothetical protein Cfor_03273 [Coptotermes formosanus]|uniref:polypeptide N-acetylgalactosaminyltransferase n=1 Tax=Coptotermes formosanus TaxID=36987 RepID=A0A6L2PFF2_COPFO|nr:hypothetical protein Cfor_03273 [Coptotermes formosanus]
MKESYFEKYCYDLQIRSVAAPELCVDTENKKADERFGLKECIKDNRRLKGEQNFILTWHKDIRPKGRTMCWDVSDVQNKAAVNLFPCHGMQGNQLWRYNPEQQWLVHGGNPRCLDSDPGRQIIYAATCDTSSLTQKWRFESIDFKALSNWDNIGPN